MYRDKTSQMENKRCDIHFTMKIAVIGAGIIGISTAYRLKTTFPDLNVTVLSKEFSPNTTSDVAAGLWEPVLASETPVELVKKWSKETYDYVINKLKNDPDAVKHGLSRCHGHNLSKKETIEIPYWLSIAHDSHILTENDLKSFPSYVKSGFSFTTVIIEPSKYISWLTTMFKNLGGKAVRQEVASLVELGNIFDIVVNCTGLGSEKLLNDEKMYPVKGQVIRVKAPWVREFMMLNDEDGKLSYIIPNQDFVVVGGTAGINNPSTEIVDEDKFAILERVQELYPSLKYAEHVSDLAGSRPCRSSMRVEREDLEVRTKTGKKIMKVVHNYGHGGSGVTVHWGCAGEAVQIITQCVNELQKRKSKL